MQALDALSLLVAVLDRNGRVRFANTALEDALGMSRRHLQGLDFAAFFSDPAPLSGALPASQRQGAAALR